ncbi:ABC transporter permease [Vibrio superstes]|uniref:ABC transporter permease n=1 Tax=Vibrio superstes NBRC 103154 TaxID=1219062 RepID=A0A511QTV5_9VIBR|nr:ABC transporter permease [Vibrio superstes]GEM80467.1 ABC transporter permease [Vibrio superstes NBRC 103154]
MSSFTLSQRIGFGLIISLLFFVAFEWVFWGHDPWLQNLDKVFASPSLLDPLGTDQFGRSNIARLSSALQTSLLMVLVAVITSSTLGVLCGVIAGWKQGWFDRVLSCVVNIVLALPGLILVLLFGALIPGSFFILYVAISLVLWVEYFRVIRARTLTIVRLPEVEASKLFGFGPWYIFKRHLWPAFRKDVFTLACFGAGNAVLALASVGFVYVGLRPPHAELGLMMVELFPYYSDAPWVLIQPLIAVVVMVLGFHLIAGGERG